MASLGTLGTVSVDIRACLDGLNGDLRAGAKAITASLENAGKRLSGVGERLTDSIGKPLREAGLDAIQASSDAAEMQSRFKTAFGDAADDLAQWAAEQESALDRSKLDLQDYLATLQDSFEPLGFAAAQATETSKAVTTLTEDLASFEGLDTGDVLRSLTSALRGNIEGWEDLKDAALDAIQNIILDLAELESVQTGVGNFFGSLFGSIFGSGSTASSAIRSDAAGRVLGGIAGGGLIRGPGTGTSDSILARLSNGEFVVNARAAQAHLPLLEAINAGGLRAFAAGGLALPRIATPNLPQMIEAPREGPADGDPGSGAGAGFHVHFDHMTREEIGRSLPQVRRAALGFLAKGGAR